jgi:hypothetical protein
MNYHDLKLKRHFYKDLQKEIRKEFRSQLPAANIYTNLQKEIRKEQKVGNHKTG